MALQRLMRARDLGESGGMPSLKVLAGPNPDEVFPIKNGDTIGRDPANEIAIAAPGVSRRHVQIVVAKDEVWLHDLGSANGTFVNGTKVAKHRLAEGDTISMSEVTLRFSLASASPPKLRTQARRPLPDTEPFDTEKARALLLDEGEKEPEEAYSFDASASVATAMDLRLTSSEQLASLQKRLHLMVEVSQALAAAREKDELLGKIMEKLLEVFPHAEHGFILLGPSVEQLRPAIVRHRKKREEKKLQVSRTIARKVFDRKRAILCHDTAHDKRFQNAKSIANLEISAFMAAPLLFRGEVLGFIQLEANRHFEKEDLNLLAGLAASAASFLKTVKLIESVAREVKEREAIQSELRVASRIQAALLPHQEPSLPWLEIAGRMKTAKEVGGDYYDFIQTPSGELYVAIGDVSGKGVPAGLIMVMARSILHSLLEARPQDLRAVCVETNRLLKKDLKPGMFLSLLLAWCDSRTKTLKLAGCGHERPLVFNARTGDVTRIELGGTVLGVVADNSKQVAVTELGLEPGDQLLLYTDGVPEAQDAAKKPFTLARLEGTLKAHGRSAPRALIEAIEKEVLVYSRDREQHDDITLIALRRP